MLKALCNAFADLLFPPRCHICRSLIPEAGRVHICTSCLAGMRFITSPICSICGNAFHGACKDHVCGPCLLHRPHYELARAAVVHDGACRDLIHSFKYSHRIHLRMSLALLTVELLSLFAAQVQADVIVPVPLHVRRLRQRGFNQSILLGQVLSREWGIPLERRAMLRNRWTEPQINLSADQRLKNVRGAFSVSNSTAVANRSVMLVDDVFTTGSTVDECARVLKHAGASRVVVVTVARAVL